MREEEEYVWQEGESGGGGGVCREERECVGEEEE